MDEIEFSFAYGEAVSLIDKLDDAELQFALRAVLRLINGINSRLLEMQTEEDDD